MTAQLTRKRTYTTIDTSVDVDITDLVENGWHHEDDCPAREKLVPGLRAMDATSEAIASLHRQAHPSEHADPWLCHEEPCRSIDGDLLRRA